MRSGAPNMAVSCVWPSSILRAFLQGCLLVTSAVDPHAILRAARYYCRYGLRKFLGAVSSQERPYSVESSASECHHKLKVCHGGAASHGSSALLGGTGCKGRGPAGKELVGSPSSSRAQSRFVAKRRMGTRGTNKPKKSKKETTTMRFELTRAEHISLAGIGGIKNPNARARKTLNFV